MRILVTSLVDVRNCAPNRLHHLINYLSNHNEVYVICPFDWWRGQRGATRVSYDDFSELMEKIHLEYITSHRFGPVLQEVLISRLNRPYSNIEFDLIFNYNTLNFGRQASISRGLPAIYDIADNLPEMVAMSSRMPGFAGNLARSIARKMVQMNVMQSRKVTAISQVYQGEYNIPNSRFEILPNGVDTNHFRQVKSDLREKLGLKKDSFLLGYVGVLREWVDLEPVFRAMKLMDDLHLIIVGEEGWLNRGKQLINVLSIKDKVIAAGTVPYAQLPAYISVMDCCLIPFDRSRISQYSVPLKLFEYMSCGKPVISTDIAGVRGVAGERITYAGSVGDYVDSIRMVMGGSYSSTDLLENRDFVRRNYDWSISGGRLEAIMEGMI